MAAPQINPETYVTRVYTVLLAIPSMTYGKLYSTNNGGATETGTGTHQLTFEGSRTQVNTALTNFYYEPAPDFELATFNLLYTQTDDAGTGATGSNPVNGTMVMSVGTTHAEFSIIAAGQSYDEDTKKTIVAFGSITDERPENIDANLIYRMELTTNVLNALTGITNWTTVGNGTTFRYEGLKAACNAELASIELVPYPDYAAPFTLTYSQSHTAGAVDQSSAPAISFSINITHDEYTTSNQAFNEDEATTWTIATVTDERPENIDSGIIYNITLTLNPIDAGIITGAGWTNPSEGNYTLTGTKSTVNGVLATPVTFTPKWDYDTDFIITYTQQADGVLQGQEDLDILVGTTHDEVLFNTAQTFTTGVDKTFDLGDVTDLRRLLDPSVRYTAVLSDYPGRIGGSWVTSPYEYVDDTNAYGFTTALSNDGLTMVGGGRDTDVKVYVYDKGPMLSFFYVLEQTLGQAVGESLDVSGDGNTLVYATTTHAEIWTRAGATWTLEQSIADGGPGGTWSSTKLSSDGNTLALGNMIYFDGVISPGAVEVWTRAGTTWTLEQLITASDKENGADFGYHIDLSADGNVLAVGAVSHNSSGVSQSGQAYTYRRAATVWTEEQIFTPPSAGIDSVYGVALTLTPDGTQLAIIEGGKDGGFVGVSKMQLWKESGGTWTLYSSIADVGGYNGYPIYPNRYNIAISPAGEHVFISLPIDGATSFTSQGSTVWVADSTTFNGGGNTGVTISANGEYLVVNGDSIAQSYEYGTYVKTASLTDATFDNMNGALLNTVWTADDSNATFAFDLTFTGSPLYGTTVTAITVTNV